MLSRFHRSNSLPCAKATLKATRRNTVYGRTKYMQVYCIVTAIYPFFIAPIWHFEFKLQLRY